MKQKLYSLYLLDVKRSKRSEYFLNEFMQDPLIHNFLRPDVTDIFNCDCEIKKIEVGNTYFVSYDGKHPIGLLRLHSLSNFGVLTLHYGIHPDFRRKGYGSLLLQEISSYLFQHQPEIEAIELAINRENMGSIKCAQNAGFCEEIEKNGVKVYQKRR